MSRAGLRGAAVVPRSEKNHGSVMLNSFKTIGSPDNISVALSLRVQPEEHFRTFIDLVFFLLHVCLNKLQLLSVKLHLWHKQNKQTYKETRSFVCSLTILYNIIIQSVRLRETAGTTEGVRLAFPALSLTAVLRKDVSHWMEASSLLRQAWKIDRPGFRARVTMTTDSSDNGATTLSRMNFSAYVGHVTMFSWMFTIACCLGLGLDLVSGWSTVMHAYLYYFPLSLSLPRYLAVGDWEWRTGQRPTERLVTICSHRRRN